LALLSNAREQLTIFLMKLPIIQSLPAGVHLVPSEQFDLTSLQLAYRRIQVFDPDLATLARLSLVRARDGMLFAGLDEYEAVGKAGRSVGLINAGDYVGAFKTNLLDCARKWINGCEFLAPYQARKSKMVMDLCDRGVFVLPICFRHDPNPCLFPPQTTALFNWAVQSPPISDAVFTNQMCGVLFQYLKFFQEWLLDTVGNVQSVSELAMIWGAVVSDRFEMDKLGGEIHQVLTFRASNFPTELANIPPSSESVAVA
jgi:hypothetical protein